MKKLYDILQFTDNNLLVLSFSKSFFFKHNHDMTQTGSVGWE